jgi:SAM-dependent methyltransferase
MAHLNETARSEELAAWLATAPGRYLLAWEQQRVDGIVGDLFGFHALQLGLPALDALRTNRMPHRWCASDELWPLPSTTRPWRAEGPAAAAPPPADAEAPTHVRLHCDFDALPFPNHSLDLVVMPHTLEFARDPHRTLREVERVLVPEGRVVIFGFNPASLWGLRQRVARGDPFLPRSGEFIGYWRLRDWLRLLSFEVEGGRFGCYAPPLTSPRWLERFGWMDRLGDRWWPVLGAVYSLVMVKRVRGMRLVGLARDARRRPVAAPAVVTTRQGSEHPRPRVERVECLEEDT